MLRYVSTFIPGIVLAHALCLSLAGCGNNSSVPLAPSPTSVKVSYPFERNITDYVDFTGQTEAVKSAEIRARVDGHLIRIPFKEGAEVKVGDLLFEIDPRPSVAELNRAKAQLEQAQTSVTQSEAQLNVAQADEGRAVAGLDYARRRLERSKRLLPIGAMTQDDFDLQRSQMLQAQADLQRAQAQIASSQATINNAKAVVHSAEAAVAIAELNLKHTKVTAPIDGQVGRCYVTEGNLVQSGQMGGGTLLAKVVSVDPMYADFNVDEQTLLHTRQLVRDGKNNSPHEAEVPVALGLSDNNGFPHKGIIHFMDNQMNPQTGTLLFRGLFPNPYKILCPGMFARVRVQVGKPHQALLVAECAIETDQGQTILYVVNEKNEVVYRSVRVGALHDGLRVIEEGLLAGDRVIVSGVQSVRPGVIVEPKLTEMPVWATVRGSAEMLDKAPNSPTTFAKQVTY